MSIVFIGKRFYTNKDAFIERYGRIYQLPFFWAESQQTRLWLIDYHTRKAQAKQDGLLGVQSTPVFSISWFREAISTIKRKPEIIVASGDTYIGLLGYILARITRCRFVFDVYDKYDEFGVHIKLFGFSPFHYLLQHSDMLMFASQHLATRYAPLNRNQHIAPNGIDPQVFRPRPMAESRRALNISENKVFIGYFGSMDSERGFSDLMEAVKKLRDKGMLINILIAGKAEKTVDLNQEHIYYLGNMPHRQVAIAMAACNFLALPYRQSTYLDNASSCKIAEYLAIKRPIVATRTPNFVENFPLQSLQLEKKLAEPGNPTSLAESINHQSKSPTFCFPANDLTWRNISKRSYSFLKHIHK